MATRLAQDVLTWRNSPPLAPVGGEFPEGKAMWGMRAFWIALTSAMALAVAAPAATAQGTYDVVSCEANGQPVATSAWTPSFSGWAPDDADRGENPITDECAGGHGLRIDFGWPRRPGPLSASWQFVAPSGTTIGAVKVRRRAESWSACRFSRHELSVCVANGLNRPIEQSRSSNIWQVGSAYELTAFPSLGDECRRVHRTVRGGTQLLRRKPFPRCARSAGRGARWGLTDRRPRNRLLVKRRVRGQGRRCAKRVSGSGRRRG